MILFAKCLLHHCCFLLYQYEGVYCNDFWVLNTNFIITRIFGFFFSFFLSHYYFIHYYINNNYYYDDETLLCLCGCGTVFVLVSSGFSTNFALRHQTVLSGHFKLLQVAPSKLYILSKSVSRSCIESAI